MLGLVTISILCYIAHIKHLVLFNEKQRKYLKANQEITATESKTKKD